MQEGPPKLPGVGQEFEVSDGVEPVVFFKGNALPRVEGARALAETVVRCVASGDLVGARAAAGALTEYVAKL